MSIENPAVSKLGSRIEWRRVIQTGMRAAHGATFATITSAAYRRVHHAFTSKLLAAMGYAAKQTILFLRRLGLLGELSLDGFRYCFCRFMHC